MRFISPKTDFAFKKIFGSENSKDILISFLNALLYAGEPRIEDLEILDPYSAGKSIGLKDSYLDVKAKLSNQKIVIIEMQVLNVIAFDKRVIYNAAKTYSTQLKSGEGYSKLNPVIALTITDFMMFKNTERLMTRFKFKEDEELFDYPNYEIELVFVELPKFQKTLEELESITDKWIYFIKNAPDLTLIPDRMKVVPELNKALEIANQANLNDEEREDLEKREMFIFDQQGAIEKGIEEGRQQGIEQGRQQGIEQGRQQGIEQGRQQGQVNLMVSLLVRRFGDLPQSLQAQIETLSGEQLTALGEAMFAWSSIQDLEQWLIQLR